MPMVVPGHTLSCPLLTFDLSVCPHFIWFKLDSFGNLELCATTGIIKGRSIAKCEVILGNHPFMAKLDSSKHHLNILCEITFDLFIPKSVGIIFGSWSTKTSITGSLCSICFKLFSGQ